MPKDSSSIIAGMGVAMGFITELVSAVKEQGGSDDDIHRLVKPEGRKIISRIAKIVVDSSETKPQLLEFIGTVTFPATSRSVVAEKFVVADSPVKIGWLGDNFKEWFLKKIEEPILEMTLCYAKLICSELDGPIMAELGEKRETTLAQIYALMERQPNGEKGILLTNGCANIFYIRDTKGVLRAVFVFWSGDGWRVGADSVSYPCRWDGGGLVFSRNS